MICAAIARCFDPGWRITPMKHTDVLCLSHYVAGLVCGAGRLIG